MARAHRPITLVLAAGLAAVSVGVAVWRGTAAWRKATEGSIYFAAYAPPSALATPFLRVPPGDMVRAFRDVYRLAPDERVLLAVADVGRSPTDRGSDAAAAKFQDKAWQVTLGQDVVGSLSELPDFPEAFDLLVGAARKVTPTRKPGGGRAQRVASVEQKLKTFLAPHLLSALRELDDRCPAGECPAAILEQAARALTLLYLQSADNLEIAGALPAKTLATLARAQVATGKPLIREQALVAHVMGYTGHAERLARDLPATDARRLYILEEDAQLKALALRSGTDGETRYLWMLRLAASGKLDDWEEGAETLFPDERNSLALLKSGLELKRFETAERFGHPLALAVFQDLSRSDSPRANDGPLDARQPHTPTLAEFEAAMAMHETTCDGAFLTPSVCRAFYEGLYFTALDYLVFHYLDMLSSPGTAQSFAAELGAGPPGVASEFQEWVQALIDAETGKIRGPDIAQKLESGGRFAHLGFYQLRRLLDEVSNLHYANASSMGAARRVFQRMDTRVEHRWRASFLVRKFLHDVRLKESLLASAVEASRSTEWDLRRRLAALRGDRLFLEELVDAAPVPLGVRTQAIHDLKDLGTTDARESAILSQRIQEDPADWTASDKYATFLRLRKDYAEARKIIEAWLVANGDKEGYEVIFARTHLARILHDEGKFQEAWNAIESVVESQQYGAMHWGVLILERLGRTDEALELAERALERYPYSGEVRAALAGFYWRRGENRKAAKTIKDAPRPIPGDSWRDAVGEEFAAALGGKPVGDAVAAFDVLAGEGFDVSELIELSDELSRAGHLEAAFAVASRLKDPLAHDLGVALRTHHHLKAWKGKPEALRWLRPRAKPRYYASFAMSIYYLGDYDLLWDLLDDLSDQTDENRDFIWMLRALANDRLGEGRDPSRQAQLAEYFQTSSGPFAPLGQFLTGGAPIEQFLAWASLAERRSPVAYCLALVAEREGDYVSASDWFRVAAETGASGHPFPNWAHMDLAYWADREVSLARLQEGKYVRRPRPLQPGVAAQ